MPLGSWIYEQSTASGGTTPYVPPDAPPVTIDLFAPDGVTPNPVVREIYDGQQEVKVYWTADPSANSDNFRGVAVFLEDPDISSGAQPPLNATHRLDGSAQLSGQWNPVRENDSFTSPAVLIVDSAPADRKVRIYLQAFGKIVNATLVRANKPSPTPSAVATIPAGAGKYVSGAEYAFLVSNPSVVVVPNFENPLGPTYSLKFGYDEPDPAIPLPPGLKAFGGVKIVYHNVTGAAVQLADTPWLAAKQPQTWVSKEYAASTGTFDALFCSVDVDGRVNTDITDYTPTVRVNITYPPPGGAVSPDVTGFAITNNRWAWQPDGTIYEIADFDWTNPDSARFGGVVFYVIDAPGRAPFQLPGARAGDPVHHLSPQIIDWPKATQAWTVAAIAIDRDGNLADDPTALTSHTPRATWAVGPPTVGNAPAVDISGATVTTEQQLSSDGVVMLRHHISGWVNPTGNQFGGVSIARIVHGTDPATSPVTWWDAQLGETEMYTDWEPAPTATSWDFFFVSRDPQGNKNLPIIPGVTPGKGPIPFTPMVPPLSPDRMPKDWFSTSEFDFPAGGDLTAKQFIAGKIFVGSILRVGGGTTTNVTDPSFAGQYNGQIAVYSNANELRAWMGQQSSGTPDNPTAHSIYGGWFKELYVGGDNPTNAPIYANSSGVVIVGGFDVAGSRYPYISIRNKLGIEVGRMGARVGQGQVGNESTIEGAWFREFAYGGQSFSDWRMLARMDATSPLQATVTMRNIDLFTIDYMANYPNPPTNQPNAAVHLEYGYSAFVTDGSTSSYWRFPGFSMTRSGTSHRAIFINRGLVLQYPGGQRAGAFVTFNGDSFGSDSANGGVFWTELTMYSNNNFAINVDLASGDATRGAAYLRLRDEFGTENFFADQSGGLTLKASLTAKTGVSAQQYFIWPGGQQVITTGGQFNGPGGVNCSGDLRCTGDVNPGGYYWGNGTKGADGSFHSQEGKLVIVSRGIITSIT